MEVDKSEIPTEGLPNYTKNSYIKELIDEVKGNETLSASDLYNKVELILIEKSECLYNDTKSNVKCKCGCMDSKFILGQFYFDHRQFKKAFNVFDAIRHFDYQALYQCSIILYDDLLDLEEAEGEIHTEGIESPRRVNSHQKYEIDSYDNFNHPNKKNWKLAVEYMTKIAESKASKILRHYAQYNVGKAYFQGFGVKQSDEQTEKWWLLASDDGNKQACIRAQTMLAFFYSRKTSREYFNLKKAYFWHQEACGNGSLESQGALGAMFYYAIGVKRDLNAAYECLTEASERGNVYALGLLCDYYYHNKFYIKAADLSEKVASLFDLESIAQETLCLKAFIAKGISLASFIYGRCLHLGKGVKQDTQLATQYYKRVRFC